MFPISFDATMYGSSDVPLPPEKYSDHFPDSSETGGTGKGMTLYCLHDEMTNKNIIRTIAPINLPPPLLCGDYATFFPYNYVA